jgi:hypothetical protein
MRAIVTDIKIWKMITIIHFSTGIFQLYLFLKANHKKLQRQEIAVQILQLKFWWLHIFRITNIGRELSTPVSSIQICTYVQIVQYPVEKYCRSRQYSGANIEIFGVADTWARIIPGLWVGIPHSNNFLKCPNCTWTSSTPRLSFFSEDIRCYFLIYFIILHKFCSCLTYIYLLVSHILCSYLT